MKKVSTYTIDSSKILSVNEVSNRLNIGKNKLYSMLEAGELKGFKIGKLWRVCSNDIDAYINDHYKKCE